MKPNCSIQSYVPALWPLLEFEPQKVIACTYQAISGAGKTFASWPEMVDNVIPYIPGEDEKSEREPMKIFGHGDQRSEPENGAALRPSERNLRPYAVGKICANGPDGRLMILISTL